MFQSRMSATQLAITGIFSPYDASHKVTHIWRVDRVQVCEVRFSCVAAESSCEFKKAAVNGLGLRLLITTRSKLCGLATLPVIQMGGL